MLSLIISRNIFVYSLLGIILLFHTFIFTKLIYFPYPELFVYPYLTNHGLKPYAQILDQHFPGLLFLPINLDNLGMNTPEIARFWSIAIVFVTHLMLFFISSKIFKSKFKAIFVNIFYLVWQPFFEGWVLWIDNFLPLLLLPAFYFLYNKRLFITGLMLGFAVIFKQTIIPLAVFVLFYIFYLTRDFNVSLRYLLGLFIPVSLVVLYFTGIGVFADFWYWTVIFNLTTYAQFGRGGEPTMAHFFRVLLVFGTPLLIIKKIKSREVQILFIFLIGALLGLSTRFDFVHFQPALPFALLATVYGFRLLKGGWKWVVTGVYGLILVWWLIIFYKGHISDRIIAFDSNTKEIAYKISQLTNSGEKIFVFGEAPHLYQMSETLPAGDIFVFQSPWFLKIAEGRILEGLKRDKPRIVISNKTVTVEDQRIIDFAADIDQYINQNYQKIDSVGTTDILRRRD